MLGAGDQERQAIAPKKFQRSVSWSDRSPNKPNPCYPRAQPGIKNRSCLPPLQPLSIIRQNVEDWPKAGSDDLGIWPQPTTPGGRIGCGLGSRPSGSSNSGVPPREFESNKDRLAFYERECSKVADHMYLGSELVAKDREILRQNGITHVLNCVGFVCPEYFKGDLVYKTLWLQDSPSEDIISILYDVFDYFEDVREQNGRVFVHCCQGVSRSASLVIAYLMWREGQSFEDAFQYVKAARGVTNPNMGFACQLLQCQKRVHAVPASPTSVLRMYRMAPHSPYDPLHLVPKMLSNPGATSLDSRGAFIVHMPSALYVWVGKYCSLVMSNNAGAAAQQVMKYEKAQGPILTVKEGEEPFEFWDNLSRAELLMQGAGIIGPLEDRRMSGGRLRPCMNKTNVGTRKITDYDLDFEVFNKALTGGVVPPFTSSGSALETRLPARENGWGRLRRKFASGIMKEFFSSPMVNCQNPHPTNEPEQIVDSLRVAEEPVSPTAHLLLSMSKSGSSGYAALDTDPSIRSPSPCSSPESFSPYAGSVPTFNSKSPSLSPSTSDYSSPFTFSPSSNWSESSNLSSQPSPSRLEFSDHLCPKDPASVETDCLFPKAPSGSFVDAFPSIDGWKSSKTCSPCKGTSPSIAERRGSNPPTLMLLQTAETICVPRTLCRSWSFSLADLTEETVGEVANKESKHAKIVEVNRDEPMLDADS